MRLFRYGARGQEKPGVVDQDGGYRDLSQVINDLDFDALTPPEMQRLSEVDPLSLPILPTPDRLGPCVAASRRFFCIGLNYADHAREAGLDLPDYPIVFMKACAISGPNDDVVVPSAANTMDWEAELGVVIGAEVKNTSVEHANLGVAGYCVVNDLSERTFQFERSGQWVKGKSFDGFAPVGPFLVTPDEIRDLDVLDIFLDVNGEPKQRGNTATMVFSVPEIVSHLSSFVTLLPGDIIATGTPPGVGMGMAPPQYLKTGDRVRLGITGLGEQNFVCISDPALPEGRTNRSS